MASSSSNILPGLHVAAGPLGARQERLATVSAEGREQGFGGAQTRALVGPQGRDVACAVGVFLPDLLACAEHTVAALSICMDLVFSVFFSSRLPFAPLPRFPSVLLPCPQTHPGPCALEAIKRCPHPRVTSKRWTDARSPGRQRLRGRLSVPAVPVLAPLSQPPGQCRRGAAGRVCRLCRGRP